MVRVRAVNIDFDVGWGTYITPPPQGETPGGGRGGTMVLGGGRFATKSMGIITSAVYR